jgi:hypothetical protein
MNFRSFRSDRRHHGRTRRARGGQALVAAPVAASLCFLPSCSLFQPEPELTAGCGVIVDASGSGGNFHADQRLKDQLDRFLTGQHCGQVDFVPLNGKSESSVCHENSLDLDPPVGDPESARTAMRGEALKRSERLLACASKEPRGSDVLGALRAVVRDRPRTGTADYSVLVVSDMIHSDDKVQLSNEMIATQASRARLIRQLAPLTPDLSGVQLFPTDLGSDIENARRAENLRRFWAELLATEQAGHATLKESYV